MPKITDKNIISNQTRKNTNRLIFLSFVIILFKLYEVPFENFEFFKVSIPVTLVDVVLLLVQIHFLYTFFLAWYGDVLLYKKWFQMNSILSQFKTEMSLNKTFLSGGGWLLEKLFRIEKEGKWKDKLSEMDEDIQREYRSFKTNIELYITRLDVTAANFKDLSKYVKYYIFVENFIFPLLISFLSLFCLLKFGNFVIPEIIQKW